MLESALTWAGIVASFLAAWLWLRSTQVSYRRKREDIREEERGIWLTTDVPGVLEQPFRTARLQNRVNALAASITALAVVLQAGSLIAHRFGW